MEIILIKEISNLGYPGDIVNVKNGYARNYLLPYKFGVQKTRKSLERLEEQRKEFEQKTQESKSHYQAIMKKFEEIKEIVISRVASKEGRIYGSVNADAISKKIKEDHDLDINKRKIVIRNPIKVLGEYSIDIQLDKRIKASFILSVKALES